ncbi:hypothetical protein BP5796_13003 [Coleophoma crateriformis]|uniref:Uncharacterized protein n=1 Tax=Coleophoma crateriformis TaxID=565419 RepID=A0A3D8Q537_9HELO|nr:hypothetical protein BP5796_13003 [Coleophoma crateriformis]
MDSASAATLMKVAQSVVALAGVSLVYALCRIIYNMYLHPLAKYPGPKMRGAWHLPYYYHLYNGTHDTNLVTLHDEYGDVVRYRPNSLSFNSAGAFKDIHGGVAGKKALQKDPEFYRIKDDESPNIIFSNDADHSRMRKLVSHAFSDAALRGQETILNHYFELLVSQLQKRADDPNVESVDMTRWYNYLTFDVIGDLAFGQPFGALESGEYHLWMRNLFQGIKFTRLLKIAKHYQPLMAMLKVVMKLIPGIAKARAEHIDFTESTTERRLQAKTDRQDFMSYILRHNDERGMSHRELMGTAEILIVGGSETTSTVLTGVTYYLLMSPEKYEKAKKEVRNAFKSGEELTLQSTAQLPYLQAVLEEGLRIYPSVPLGLSRKTPPAGTVINGKFVPGDVSVAVHHLSTYHSARNFFEPKTFVPERWLPNPPEQYANDNKAAWNPFSTGPRNCVGKNLAWNEMRSVLARMLFYFDMEICEDSREWNVEQKIHMMWDKPSLNVKITRRKD